MSRFTYERDKLPFYLPSLKFHWRVAGCRLWERTANSHSCWMPTSLKENTSRIIVLISVESPVTTAFKMQRAAQSQLQTMANQFAICHRAIKQLHKRTETRRRHGPTPPFPGASKIRHISLNVLPLFARFAVAGRSSRAIWFIILHPSTHYT